MKGKKYSLPHPKILSIPYLPYSILLLSYIGKATRYKEKYNLSTGCREAASLPSGSSGKCRTIIVKRTGYGLFRDMGKVDLHKTGEKEPEFT
jgi:hypothetical protein